MIVRMQKLTLLCLAADQDRTLEALRDLGVVHLTHVKRPEGSDLDQARNRLAHLRRVLEVLPKKSEGAPPSGQPAEEVVEAVWQLILQRKELNEELEALQHEQQRLVPFGDFEPDAIRQLMEKGIYIRLYRAGAKQSLIPPERTVLQVLSRTKTDVSFVVIGCCDFKMDAQEVRLPEKSLRVVEAKIAKAKTELESIENQMAGHAVDHDAITQLAHNAEEAVTFLEARTGMGSTKPVAYLQGFCPEDAVEPIRRAAARNGWGMVVEDPSDTDAVPTLLRNSKWVRPIKAVFDFIGVVPGYREVDISVVFLIFFSLFFSMLVGDAGYGAIFLALTWWARKKHPQAPSYIFALLTITGVGTVIWGVLTGTYFGIAKLPAPLRSLQVDWLSDQNNIMGLCFLIGAIQLSIAHLWNAWNGRHSVQALAQLGWLCTTWTMFFAAGFMVLGRPFPSFMMGVLVIGVVLIVLFMTPVKRLKTEWFNHVMLPLNLISNFVDVVSYIRLFAVGTATLAVAQAFNSMAIGEGELSWIRMFFAAVILLLGHTLNIVLAAMGVIVHGVRLNTLEFSGHLGMQWTGILYRPFAKRRNNGPAEGS
jgi:V/A-type H+-transporting ATPase subunit I